MTMLCCMFSSILFSYQTPVASLLLQILLVKFGKTSGVTVSRLWNPNVTHMIAATDEKGACTRTLKVLMAILNGRWVLKIDCKLTDRCFSSFLFCNH